MARIKLNGVESFSDLRKQYELETGRLDVGPLTSLLNPEKDPEKMNAAGRFQRGLLSPWRVFGEEAYPEAGFTGVQERQVQQGQWEHRAWDQPRSTQLGARTGFPPFHSDETNQRTGEWWKLLQQQP